MGTFLDFISISFPTMIISVANILIMYIILRKFLFGPVNKIIAKRESEVTGIYEKADLSLSESNKLKEEYKNKINNIQAEKDIIIKEAQEEAKIKGSAIINESRADADKIRKETLKDLEMKRKQMYKEMQENVAEVAVSIAEKVIEREVNIELHKDIVSNFVNELELNHE